MGRHVQLLWLLPGEAAAKPPRRVPVGNGVLGHPFQSPFRSPPGKALMTATKEPPHRKAGGSYRDQPSIRRAASAAFMPIVTPLARAGSLAVETMPSR